MDRRNTQDRLAAEQLGALAVLFPQLTTLCDGMDMHAGCFKKQPAGEIDSEHAALITTKGMQVTEPRRRRA